MVGRIHPHAEPKREFWCPGAGVEQTTYRLGGCITAKNGVTRLIVACLLATALQACESTSLGMTQIGGLPRPGLFTSFSLPDTANLTPSRDPAADRRPFPKRGIVYTRRAVQLVGACGKNFSIDHKLVRYVDHEPVDRLSLCCNA